MTKPWSGGAGQSRPVDGAAFAYQVRSRRTEVGVLVEAYGGPSIGQREVWIDLWPDGWICQVTDAHGGSIVSEGLSDKLAAVDALMRDLLTNGGVGHIDDVPMSGRSDG